MKRLGLGLVFFLLGSWIGFPSSAASLSLQQTQFLQAEAMIAHGDKLPFLHLKSQLTSFPLYPYLIASELKKNIDNVSTAEMESFLNSYANTPLALPLQEKWLITLAQKKEWPIFLRHFPPTTTQTELICYHVQALLATGDLAHAFSDLPALWLTLRTIPPACEEPIAAWKNSGGLTHDLIWNKLELLMTTRSSDNFSHLAWLLPLEDQDRLQLWQRIRENPNLLYSETEFNLSIPGNKLILINEIKYLANKNPQEAAFLWSRWKNDYPFTEAENQLLIRTITIGLARSQDAHVSEWLTQIKPAYTNQLLREWRIRLALAEKNWPQVLFFINQLSPTVQEANIWQYWKACALVASHHSKHANIIFRSLAKKLDYYGLLASHQLHIPFHPVITQTSVNMNLINNNKALQRAKELFALGFDSDARREWRWSIKDMDKNQLQAAALLAFQWKYYDLAFIGSAKAKTLNDINLRFPCVYRLKVWEVAKINQLDPRWILAIMRQESAFMPQAESAVGALGLMQLMPNTGKLLSEQLKLPEPDLLDVNTNILLGSYYLKYLLKTFKGNQTIATGAYNIGPTRIKKFVALYPQFGKEIWIEILPWQETRDYIKNVILAQAVYQQTLPVQSFKNSNCKAPPSKGLIKSTLSKNIK